MIDVTYGSLVTQAVIIYVAYGSLFAQTLIIYVTDEIDCEKLYNCKNNIFYCNHDALKR